MISRTSTLSGTAVIAVLLTIALVASDDESRELGPDSTSDLRRSSSASEPQLEPKILDLVFAEGGDWATTLPPVLALGEAAIPELMRVIERYPGAAGLQPAIAALGSVADGDARAREFLFELTKDPDQRTATEAALAIGRAGTKEDIPSLRALIENRDARARVRAAATASAIDLGDLSFAVPFTRAIVLAGSDREPERRAELGLPIQTRWAYERTMLFDAIARAADGERFGLDPDLPWPMMEQAIERFESWAKEQGR